MILWHIKCFRAFRAMDDNSAKAYLQDHELHETRESVGISR